MAKCGEVGEGACGGIFQVSLGTCKPKSSPKSHVKQGGEGVLGCWQLWVDGARKEEQLAGAGRSLCRCGRASVACLRGSLQGFPQQHTEQTPGGPLKVAEKF